MNARFHNLGFAANPVSNAFKNLGTSIQIRGARGVNCADTTLQLNPPAFQIPSSSAPKGIKRKWSLIDAPVDQQIESSLCLRLGHSSSSSDSKGSTATACTSMSSAKETEEESSMDLELDFALHLGSEKPLNPRKSARLKFPSAQPKVDLELSLSSGIAESDITTFYPSSTSAKNVLNRAFTGDGALNTDEGSMGSPFYPFPTARDMENTNFLSQVPRQLKPSISPDLSASVMTTPKSSVTCTSGITQLQQQRTSGAKQCQFQGCSKGARGASGLCIAHGGGRRCQRPGCHKGAEGRTAFCKAHGGGRRCEYLGCTKSAEGRTDFCIAHGGGRRCSRDGCTRAARGKSGLCIRHGGGKRCQRENCTKSAEGLSGLCISHGGGRRCQYPECTKGAQGSTMFCKAHGGGKRCAFLGCNKGAEGSTPFCKGHGGGKRCSFEGGGVCPKSVHGGTLFCVAHGGGKRCAVPECTKSARGRTAFCVRHGGGKRCKSEGCGKSAQGSTDFCKAHGGGKRCYWGQPDSEFGKGDGPCNSFARGKSGLCASHGALVQDNRVHGGATIGTVIQDSKINQPSKTKEIFSAEDMSVDIIENGVVASTRSWNYLGPHQAHMPVGGSPSPGTVPEGRVHGGNLVAMFAGSSGLSFTSSRDMAGSSESEKSLTTHGAWM
ncbi:loricrin-related [Abeliophyllum distichum]|uniref:Loricrin-related n=1 Tax=Abeliophyllum distichum TaxID=126358 RepID=A0ABD1TWW5_9LAMI